MCRSWEHWSRSCKNYLPYIADTDRQTDIDTQLPHRDPDESCWVESVKFNVSFLVVIRVFFEFGFSACEEIGSDQFGPRLYRVRQKSGAEDS